LSQRQSRRLRGAGSHPWLLKVATMGRSLPAHGPRLPPPAVKSGT
jgi:hypothetical protein